MIRFFLLYPLAAPDAMQPSSVLEEETYNLVVWNGAEDFVIIVCGSVPVLKPLWKRYIIKTKSRRFSKAINWIMLLTDIQPMLFQSIFFFNFLGIAKPRLEKDEIIEI